jgi:hypothetical protein
MCFTRIKPSVEHIFHDLLFLNSYGQASQHNRKPRPLSRAPGLGSIADRCYVTAVLPYRLGLDGVGDHVPQLIHCDIQLDQLHVTIEQITHVTAELPMLFVMAFSAEH